MLLKILNVKNCGDFYEVWCQPNPDITFYIPFGVKKFDLLLTTGKGTVEGKVIDLDIESGTFRVVSNPEYAWDFNANSPDKTSKWRLINEAN